MKIILQLSCDISNALAEIHCAGATHNNFTPDNVIIGDAGDGENMRVKVIGLSNRPWVCFFAIRRYQRLPQNTGRHFVTGLSFI